MRLFDAIDELGKFVGDINREVIKDGKKSLSEDKRKEVDVALEASHDLIEIQKNLNRCMRTLLKYRIWADMEVPILSQNMPEKYRFPQEN